MEQIKLRINIIPETPDSPRILDPDDSVRVLQRTVDRITEAVTNVEQRGSEVPLSPSLLKMPTEAKSGPKSGYSYFDEESQVLRIYSESADGWLDFSPV